MNDQQFYAYLAGFLDGEGCFSLVKHKNAQVKRGFHWQPLLSVGQMGKELLKWIRDKIGGGTISAGQPPMYILVLTSGPIRRILPKILPYLRNKKEEAELLWEAVSLVRHRGPRHHYDADERLEEIYKSLKLLKPRNLYRKGKRIMRL